MSKGKLNPKQQAERLKLEAEQASQKRLEAQALRDQSNKVAEEIAEIARQKTSEAQALEAQSAKLVKEAEVLDRREEGSKGRLSWLTGQEEASTKPKSKAKPPLERPTRRSSGKSGRFYHPNLEILVISTLVSMVIVLLAIGLLDPGLLTGSASQDTGVVYSVGENNSLNLISSPDTSGKYTHEVTLHPQSRLALPGRSYEDALSGAPSTFPVSPSQGMDLVYLVGGKTGSWYLVGITGTLGTFKAKAGLEYSQEFVFTAPKLSDYFVTVELLKLGGP